LSAPGIGYWKGKPPSPVQTGNESKNMNNVPVILAHGGGGAALGLILVLGFLVLIFAIIGLDRSERASKKD
jgi:hypothetical protein